MADFTMYPEFVADQVLTADHLNELFDYLDDQDRLTRSRLIGIGIVCGLECLYDGTNIQVTKGVGVTSLGYLISFDDTTFTSYRTYKLPASLNSLAPYNGFKDPVYQLIAAKDVQAGDSDIKSNTSTLSKYAVILFLEADAESLKNCTTNDCDDKGMEVTNTVRALLVSKADLAVFKPFITGNPGSVKQNLVDLVLRRFNVPYKDLQSTAEVLKSFQSIVTPGVLGQVADAYVAAYAAFKPYLGTMSITFGTMKGKLLDLYNQIDSKTPAYWQYFYDFVDDLIKAYRELILKGNAVLSACCPDEALFPYHLGLGEATVSSTDGYSNYRNYFIYSPLFNDQKNKVAELASLFFRMKGLVDSIQLLSMTNMSTAEIRITPSRWGHAPLSDRAIPYYYNPVPLYKSWSYDKTSRGKEKTNLSYSSDAYNTSPVLPYVKTPLQYELEPYDFFRIEGHIGKDYATALAGIVQQRDLYGLPFDVLALNLRPGTGGFTAADFTCYFKDLESLYAVLVSELLCKAHHPVCTIAGLPLVQLIGIIGLNATAADMNNIQLLASSLIPTTEKFAAEAGQALRSQSSANGPAGGQAAAMSGAGTTAASAPSAGSVAAAAAPSNSGGISISTGITISGATKGDVLKVPIVTAADMGQFQNVPYVKGTFLKTYCNPKAGTIGADYLAQIAGGGRFFPPAGSPPTQNIVLFGQYLYAHFYYFIDTVEELAGSLIPYPLMNLDQAGFDSKYAVFQKEAATLATHLFNFLTLLQASGSKPADLTQPEYQSSVIGALVTGLQLLAQLCIDDQINSVLDTMNQRISDLQLEQVFSGYSSRHPGLDHKAGVPRAGTFILVYSQNNTPPPPGGALGTATQGQGSLTLLESLRAAPAAGAATEGTTASSTTTKTMDALKKTASATVSDAAPSGNVTADAPDLITQMQELVKKFSGSFTAADLQTINKLGQAASAAANPAPKASIGQRVVFADFFLPYQCCSECAPFSYILQEVKPDPTVPTLDAPPNVFCNDDDHAYTVTAGPAGGTLTGAGVIAGTLQFNPHNLPAGDNVLTYTLPDGQKATKTVKIEVPKTVDFDQSSTEQPDHSFLVKLTAQATDASSYQWLVDGTPKYTTAAVQDTFSFTGPTKTITIVLNTTYDICSPSSVTHTLTLTKTPAQQDVQLTFCFATSIPVVPNLPAGSKFTWIDKGGLTATDAGTIQFAAGGLAATKTFNAKYSITDASGNVTNFNAAITIIVTSTQINITWATAPAAPNGVFTLKVLTLNATKADWKLTANNKTTFQGSGLSVTMPTSATDFTTGVLAVDITTQTGGVDCTGSLQVPLNPTVLQGIKDAKDKGKNFPA